MDSFLWKELLIAPFSFFSHYTYMQCPGSRSVYLLFSFFSVFSLLRPVQLPVQTGRVGTRFGISSSCKYPSDLGIICIKKERSNCLSPPSGDSYTATGFNISDTQPSTETPMGNPPAPGITFSNGRNWLNYLTSTYNASSLLTYNFAAGGATIDPDIFISRIPSFRNQVSDIFLPTYGNASTASWDSSNSLFITFFGINDVGITYRTPNASLTSRIIDSYTAGLEELYLSGARNFLVVNVPAVHRAPATTGLNHSADFVEAERKGITDFNRRVRGMGEGVVKTHNDATVFVFDAFTVFSEILDDPGSYEGSGGIVDTVGFCGGYSR